MLFLPGTARQKGEEDPICLLVTTSALLSQSPVLSTLSKTTAHGSNAGLADQETPMIDGYMMNQTLTGMQTEVSAVV